MNRQELQQRSHAAHYSTTSTLQLPSSGVLGSPITTRTLFHYAGEADTRGEHSMVPSADSLPTPRALFHDYHCYEKHLALINVLLTLFL